MTTENSTKQKKKVWPWLLPALAALGIAAALGASMALEGTGIPEPTATPLPSPTPAPIVEEEPGIQAEAGYFPTEDGLFRPDEPLTRGEAAEIFAVFTGETPDFGPEDSTFSELSFPVYLKRYFEPEAVAEAMQLITGRGDALISRAEAAVCLNLLTGLTPAAEPDGYYPDVAPGCWAYEHILTAAGAQGSGERLSPGYVHLDGYLYCVDEQGYFRKNSYINSLFFGHDGRYTSGSTELDGYVAQVLAEIIVPEAEPIDNLRTVYEYVRDSFTYLKRNYYNTGDTGWQVQEALTMYSTGRGNCYCYAAAFWAAARGLGYDAKIVSGTIGREHSPHGWVEILLDGERYTFDVEIEMARRRDGESRADMYMMSDGKRSSWGYVEYAFADDMMPRETEEALLPR